MIFQEFRLWCFVRNRTEGAASVSEHDSQRPKRPEICGPHRAIDNSDMKLNELFEQVKIINLPERGDRRREMNLQLRRIGDVYKRQSGSNSTLIPARRSSR